MNLETLRAIVQQTKEAMDKLLNVKGGEYANSDDRLANFKRGAGLTGVTPLQVLFVYLSKHYDGVASFIRKSASGEPLVLSEPIEGRLDDIIVYCTLAKAILAEERTIASLEHDRDSYGNRSGIHGECPSSEVRPAVLQSSPLDGNELRNDYDVHSVESYSGIHAEKDIQPIVPPIVERRLTTKESGDPQCAKCHYNSGVKLWAPCSYCYNADHFSPEGRRL